MEERIEPGPGVLKNTSRTDKTKKQGSQKPEPIYVGGIIGWLSMSFIFPTTIRLSAGNATISKIPFLTVIKDYFLRAYGLDGYDRITNEVTSADGKIAQITQETGKPIREIRIPFGFILLSFFGIPNRPESIKDGVPTFSFLQFLRNLIGGWSPIKETITGKVVEVDNFSNVVESDLEGHFSQKRWNEKKIFQSFYGLAFCFKLFVIAPIKIISIPFKILLNIVKLVTEVLLPLVSSCTALLNTYMVYATVWLTKKLVNYKEGEQYEGKVRMSFEPLRMLIFIPLLIMAELTIAVGIIQYAMLWACRIGLALTSPEKSARLAYESGKLFKVGVQDGKLQKTVSYIMGGLGFMLSMAMSAVLWTITLPLALGTLTTVFPAILTAINWVAQLPFVASSLAWFSQWPIVTSSTALINSFFATVGAALTTAFGPAVTALALVIGVKVPTAVMLVGTTLGLIVTPIAAVLSRGADAFSNLWAKWVEQAPVASALAGLKAWISRMSAKGDRAKSSVELDKISSRNEGPQYRRLVDAQREGSDPQDLLAKEPSVLPSPAPKKDEAYVYYPHEGVYIVSPKPLYLVYELKKAEEETQKFLVGLKVRGEQAGELFDRAKNVALKGLYTQGVTTPTIFVRRDATGIATSEEIGVRYIETTGEGTREKPFVLGN